MGSNMTQERQALLREIRKAFGNGCFDTSSILGVVRGYTVWEAPGLVEAVQAVTAQCRQRRTQDKTLRRVLTEMAGEGCFTTDRRGWWRVAEAQPDEQGIQGMFNASYSALR